jgi:uncharacterized protein (UPF0276 family)
MTAGAPLTFASTPESTATRAPHEGGGLRTGIGLRAVHHEEILAHRPGAGWLEAHSENYFAQGGSPHRIIRQLREHYAVSLHGVGLSLGSTDPIDRAHLRELGQLVRDTDPLFVSEHLSWASVGGRFANDLLPLPYTEEALRHMISRVRQVQDFLGRQILIENVSSYLEFSESQLPEWDFLAALCHETDCALLLDVNNVYVSAMNHGFDPHHYLNRIPRRAVQEMHLAGHSIRRIGNRDIRIDTHDAPVCEAVWALYSAAIERFGRVPTLIEWDSNIPTLAVLLEEARKADRIAERRHARAA